MSRVIGCSECGEYFHELNTFDPVTGTVRIYDEITPHTVKSVSEFINQFLAGDLGVVLPSGDIRVKSIWFEIMSRGGCAKSGLAIYDILFNERDEGPVVEGYMRDAVTVKSTDPLDIVLTRLRHNKQPMGVVVNEQDAACGIVTIEDILEEIVGEIEDKA